MNKGNLALKNAELQLKRLGLPSEIKKNLPITHAYALWAANVLLAVFAPAFPLSLLRQEIRPQAAQAHSLGRYGQANKKKRKKRTYHSDDWCNQLRIINFKNYYCLH